MKILFVWPKARTDPDWGGDLGAIAEPLALEYLAAAVQLDGHEARILDQRLHPGTARLRAEIEAFEPDMVGVTAFSMHVLAALAVCREVKALRPECLTIAGGHHATFLPEDFFEPEMDFVVSGEGVIPLTALLQALAGDRAAIPPIAGLWVRNGGRFELGAPNRAAGVESLPAPDRTITGADRASYFIDWLTPVACLRTSVGCPYRCTFCSLWQMTDGRYHMRDIDPVVAELATIQEEFVFLIDDEAFINPKRMLRLAAAIKAEGIRKNFFAYCRMDTLVRNRAVLEAWREIGLDRLLIGIDGANPRLLAEYNKGYDLAKIDEGLDVATALGIEIFAQFVVHPDYTHREFEQLARFVEHHRIRYPSFTVLTPLPGTPLLANFDKVTRFQPNGRPNWDLFDTQNAVTATRLPPDEFHRAYRDLFRRFSGAYTLHRSRHGAPGPAIRSPVGQNVAIF